MGWNGVKLGDKLGWASWPIWVKQKDPSLDYIARSYLKTKWKQLRVIWVAPMSEGVEHNCQQLTAKDRTLGSYL